MLKNCSNCAYARGSFEDGVCSLSGFYMTVERKIPTECGDNFERWIKKETLFEKIGRFLNGFKRI